MKYSIAMLSVILVSSFFSSVYAESVNVIKSQLDEDERKNCEIQVTQNLYHIPVRIELEHEPVDSTDPKAQQFFSTGSDIRFEKNDDSIIIITEQVNEHQATVILNYEQELEPDTKREVFYRIYSNADPVEEGILLSSEDTFCKVFWFFAQDEPIVYNEAYFEERFTEIQGNKFDEILTNQEEGESFNILMGVMGLFGVLGGSTVGIVVFIKFKDIKASIMSTVKPLQSVTKQVGRIYDILDLDVTSHRSKINEGVEKIIESARRLEHSSHELTLINAGLKKQPEQKDEVTFVPPEEIKQSVKQPVEQQKGGFLSKIGKTGSVIKDQFTGSDKPKDSPDDMDEEALHKYYSKKTYDELYTIMQKLSRIIENHEETKHDRLKYDVAYRVIQKK